MTACKEFDLLLSLHAAGALDPAERERVEAHLAACPACRAEAAADAEALSLAKLPPPSEAERRALADRPRRAIAELHRADRRRASWKRAGVAVAVAAAALLAVLSPAVLRPPSPVPADLAQTAEVEEVAAWEEPDLDTLWDDAGLLDLDAAASSDLDEGDAALAALDL